MEKPTIAGAEFYCFERITKRGDKTVVSRRKHAVFVCQCGKRFVCLVKNIRIGNTKSCGCHNNKVRAERGRRQLITHGKTRTREFRSWESAKQRCYNKNATGYERYGGVGVTVCDRWINSFQAFLEDMGPRPPKTSLDRINPFGNYEPENCRWADPATQNRNTRKKRGIVSNDTKILSNRSQ